MQAVAPLINEVFDQFQTLYGRKYTSRFGDQKQIDKTKRVWAIAFIKEQVTFEQINFAIQQILYMRLPWPPELLEFLEICDNEDITGIPSLEDVTQRIVECNTRYRHTKEGYAEKHLTHPLAAYLNTHCAKHVNKPEDVFKKHMTREYQAALMKFKAGTLPKHNKALPAPVLAHATQDYQPVNPNSPFMQRVKQMGELFRNKHD